MKDWARLLEVQESEPGCTGFTLCECGTVRFFERHEDGEMHRAMVESYPPGCCGECELWFLDLTYPEAVERFGRSVVDGVMG